MLRDAKTTGDLSPKRRSLALTFGTSPRPGCCSPACGSASPAARRGPGEAEPGPDW